MYVRVGVPSWGGSQNEGIVVEVWITHSRAQLSTFETVGGENECANAGKYGGGDRNHSDQSKGQLITS